MKLAAFMTILLLTGPAFGITTATSAQLARSQSDKIVGTVVGVGATQEFSPGAPYALADLLVNEVVSSRTPGVQKGKILEVWISFIDLGPVDRRLGKTASPQAALVDYGRISFDFKGPHLTEQEVRDAILGNQYFFNLTGTNGRTRPIQFTFVWPMKQSAWVRACWTGQCPSSAPPLN
jgi:hypothetical protein